MPRLSCWFIRAALIHLGIGVAIGGLILSAKGFPATLGWSWALLLTHMQLLIGGWMIQLALGVAYWILPRLDGAGNRGRPVAAWTSFVALNLGAGGAALLFALRATIDGAWFASAVIVLALLQVLALASFGWHAWPRLRPVETPEIPRRPGQAAGAR